MSANTYGPVRRAAGILGLLALAPTGIGLLSGTLTPTDAAIRGAVTLLGAMVVARVASWWLRSAVERPRPSPAIDDEGPASPLDPVGPTGTNAGSAGPPRRRSTDNLQTTS
jgi:hypothetical protein